MIAVKLIIEQYSDHVVSCFGSAQIVNHVIPQIPHRKMAAHSEGWDLFFQKRCVCDKYKPIINKEIHTAW
jgi:hypothetical protein